jgi:hypothetical protein
VRVVRLLDQLSALENNLREGISRKQEELIASSTARSIHAKTFRALAHTRFPIRAIDLGGFQIHMTDRW